MESSLITFILAASYLGIFFTVAAEIGLFFGFVLPGESILFIAGLLAAQGALSIWILLPVLILAAVAGDAIGYWTGRKLGNWLMKQEDSIFFQKRHIIKAQRFYEKHGGKTLVLARFVPTVRTFAPIVAGMAGMNIGAFWRFNILGGLLWATTITALGYFLGNAIPNITSYLLPIVGAVVVVMLLGSFIRLRMAKRDPDSTASTGFSLKFRVKSWLKGILDRYGD